MTTELPSGANHSADSALPVYKQELRQRVLDELAIVQGRVALASHLDPAMAKEQLRFAHSAQRIARLTDAADWISKHESSLIQHFANGTEVDPSKIDPVVIPVRTPLEADLFRYATLQWSVPVSSGYGRRSRFLVTDRQNGKLIAIFALGDPVIAQASRDAAVGWNTEQRNKRLYNVYDAFILGAVEPYRELLGGKLVALLTLSNEVREFLVQKYGANTTLISGHQKDPTPVLITTSSALGRSSVYNRVTFEGNLMFHPVGFTKGFGHFQFSDMLFEELREYVRDEVLAQRTDKAGASAYGSGPNWRFRIIRNALKALDIPEESLQHNVKREVFLAPTAAGWDSYLRGETDDFEPFDLPTARIGAYYRERWAIGRAERRPTFALWNREDGRLTRLLASMDAPKGIPTRLMHGRVDMGEYSIAVGVGKKAIRGTTANGVNEQGVAYLSRLEGPNLMMTIADIEWGNGEREVRGWDRHDSDPRFQMLVGRLRLGVRPAERFRNMSSAELGIARTLHERRNPQVYKTTTSELTDLLGFDVVTAFDNVSETTVGTRAALLKDEGPRRLQLAAVFDKRDHIAPVLAWALTRAIPFALESNQLSKPTSPVVVRRPPTAGELPLDES